MEPDLRLHVAALGKEVLQQLHTLNPCVISEYMSLFQLRLNHWDQIMVFACKYLIGLVAAR